MDWRFEYIDLKRIQRFMEKTENWDKDKQQKFYDYLWERKDKFFQSELGECFVKIYAQKLEEDGAVLPHGITGERQEPKKKTLRALLWKSLPVLLLMMTVSAGSIWAYQKVEAWDAKKHLESLQEAVSSAETQPYAETVQQESASVQASNASDGADIALPDKKGEEVHEQHPPVLEKYKSLSEQYPELFGWLTIPDTGINYPVMQPVTDKDYYLHHNYEGDMDAEGALFVDPESKDYPLDDNIVIYGHNMKNGHMFGELKNYSVESYFQNNPEIVFDTIYETNHYQVIAVVQTHIKNEEEDGFRYYQFFNYETQDEFQECVDFIRENQVYGVEDSLQYGDQLLMLSTCDYAEDNGRFVVVARKEVN